MSYKEGTFTFWIKINRNPDWLKIGTAFKFVDQSIGDAHIKITKIPDMKLYVEHYHPLTYIRTLSCDLSLLDTEKDHHIALTWSPVELILYIDGEPAAKIENKIMASVV